MKFDKPLTAAALAKQTGARLLGDGDILVTGINEIHHVEPGDLCFVDFHKYYRPTLESAASVILIDQEYDCPPGKALLVHATPFAVFNALLWGARPQEQYIPQPVFPKYKVGRNTEMYPGNHIGRRAVIGDDCHIGPGVVIGDGCVIGDRVVIEANTVIGGEAFYYKKDANGYTPWRSVGSVRIEDDVQIGPGCTIARGVTSVTTIGRGSKLDAQVQIGHDCVIGPHCLLASQVGVAGNTTIGEWCVLLGQVGIAQNLTIGPRALIAAKSGVSKDLEGGKQYFGYPAQEMRDQLREWAILRRLRREGG